MVEVKPNVKRKRK